MADFLRALLFSSVSGGVLAALLFLIKPFAKNRISKRSQYYIWFLVFLRFLLPFTISGGFFGGLIPAVRSPASAAPAGITAATGGLPASAAGSIGAAVSDGVVRTIDYGGQLMQSIYSFALSLWLLGLIMLLGVNITGYIGYARQLKAARMPVDDKNTLELLEVCRKKLGLPGLLPLYVSALTDTPMLCGLFRSSIILPDRGFAPAQLRDIFMHELVHYRRRDNILKWVTVLSISLHWFNPLAYLAAGEVSRQCELSCDEAATADFSKEERIAYGRTLLDVASINARRPFALSATMGEDKRNLKERLETFIKAKKISRKTAALSATMFVFAAALTVLTVMLCGANKNPPASQSGSSSASGPDISVSGSESPGISGSEDESILIPVSSDPDADPQIISSVSDELKSKHKDINITNEWLSAKFEEDRYIVLFGSLKNDPRQGVA